jgi:hypothetical protein
LKAKVENRTAQWSNRYDPFQLLIEHEALASTKLSGRSPGPRASFVRFDHPDQGLRSTEDEGAGAAAADALVRKILDIIGIEEAGLIPEFALCRFTYGYPRRVHTCRRAGGSPSCLPDAVRGSGRSPAGRGHDEDVQSIAAGPDQSS